MWPHTLYTLAACSPTPPPHLQLTAQAALSLAARLALAGVACARLQARKVRTQCGQSVRLAKCTSDRSVYAKCACCTAYFKKPCAAWFPSLTSPASQTFPPTTPYSCSHCTRTPKLHPHPLTLTLPAYRVTLITSNHQQCTNHSPSKHLSSALSSCVRRRHIPATHSSQPVPLPHSPQPLPLLQPLLPSLPPLPLLLPLPHSPQPLTPRPPLQLLTLTLLTHPSPSLPL